MSADDKTTAESLAPSTAPTIVTLVFVSEGQFEKATLIEGEQVLVGRVPPANVLLTHPTVSRRHARFSLENGVVHLTDDGSRNGLSLNGKAVTSATVAVGDSIRLGDVDVWVLGPATARDQRSSMLSPRGFVLRVDEELERARFSGRPVHVVAMRHTLPEQDSDWIARATLGLRAIDRASEYAPHVLLGLLIEQDAAGAVSLVEQLRKRARVPTAIGLVAAPPGPMNGEALIAAAIDRAQRNDVATRAHIDESGTPTELLDAPVIGSPIMHRLFDLAARTGHADIPVCIYGETGAGKEVVARAFHQASRRSSGPFCEVNCAAIAPSLVESLLFGHEKGAFTGADKRTVGLFEQAEGGTLFLDEIGELSASTQRALLRALETKRVRRVGATQELAVDARVIAATHRNLRELVEQGVFREDLLYRLEGLTVRVPPLRERQEEIDLLADQFLRLAASKWNASARTISAPARAALQRYPWPGNVRQLRNAIERAAAVCTGDVIELDDLPEHLFEAPAIPSLFARASLVPSANLSLADEVRDYEVARVRDALAKSNGNRSEAARLLGIPRRTLGGKIKEFGLE